MMDLDGDLALVTGGARGLGAAIAAELGARGARVIVADIDREQSQHTATELRDRGITAIPLDLDVSDPESVAAAVRVIATEQGAVSILVNNAGIVGGGRVGDPGSDETWRKILDVNLDGAYRLTSALLEQLKSTRGRIVNVSSVAGLRSSFANAGYAVSKAGLAALTGQLARELGPLGIRVNAVAPGYFDTRMGMKGQPAGEEWVSWHVPMGRFAEPSEIAGPVAFLVSPAASYVHGVTLPVDGGYLVV